MSQNDTVAVTEAVEAFHHAITSVDAAALAALTADELTYGHSSGRLETKAEFIEAIRSGKSGFSEIAVSDQTVSVVDNVAMVRHVFAGKTLSGGKNKIGVLTIWLRRQDQWKLVARQAVKL